MRTAVAMLALCATLPACGGGSAGGQTGDSGGGCTGTCALSTPTALSVAEVQRVIIADQLAKRGTQALIGDRTGGR